MAPLACRRIGYIMDLSISRRKCLLVLALRGISLKRVHPTHGCTTYLELLYGNIYYYSTWLNVTNTRCHAVPIHVPKCPRKPDTHATHFQTRRRPLHTRSHTLVKLKSCHNFATVARGPPAQALHARERITNENRMARCYFGVCCWIGCTLQVRVTHI